MCIILALEIVEMAKLGSTESPRARPAIFRRFPMAGNPWRYSHIRRPRPSPRQGRRLGPPQVWNLSFLASNAPMLRGSLDSQQPWISMPFASTVQPRRQKLQGHINGFLALKPAVCQPVNASKATKVLGAPTNGTPQGQINGFFWAFTRPVCHAFNAYND